MLKVLGGLSAAMDGRYRKNGKNGKAAA